MKNLELLVTLWPTMPHFARFAYDSRLSAIRLNSAMADIDTIGGLLEGAKKLNGPVPLYFDVKGRQLRVKEVLPNNNNLELVLNHPISVETPTVVLFKAGADKALLKEVSEDGTKLVFDGGPYYKVKVGESLHIRHPSLNIYGPLFVDYELARIDAAKKAGFNKWLLSYVEEQNDLEEFRNYIGNGEVILKIESKKGLEYVANDFKKVEGVSLMAARGDMYVEVDKPHDILAATRLIINKDPEATVGSRILLTLSNQSVPECADLCELAWLYDIGYRKMMLCDGLCMKEDSLARAINVIEHFKGSYAVG